MNTDEIIEERIANPQDNVDYECALAAYRSRHQNATLDDIDYGWTLKEYLQGHYDGISVPYRLVKDIAFCAIGLAAFFVAMLLFGWINDTFRMFGY